MSDEGEPVTAIAKAVEETAKTGRALIEPGTKLAEYVARMLGTIPEDVIGFLIGDPLHELRQHTLTGITCWPPSSAPRQPAVATARPCLAPTLPLPLTAPA